MTDESVLCSLRHQNNLEKQEDIWVHVDMNSYFATVLQQENPALRGKPVAVVKDHGRTCVIASSKEAKRCGVGTGCSMFEAKRLCPGIVALPAHFALYLSCTQKLYDLWRSLVPVPEIFSMDEAFLHLGNCRLLYPDPILFGEQIQKRVKEALGSWVTCNVGIGPTRLLAKMIGEVSMKGTVMQVTHATKWPMLASTEFKDVCGIGRRLEKRLRRIGVTTPLQILFVSRDVLESLVGPFWVDELQKMAVGEDPAFLKRIRMDQLVKSIGRTTTGFSLCNDEQTIKRTFFNLCEEIMEKARQERVCGRTVQIFIQGHDQFWHARCTGKRLIAHTQELFQVVYDRLYCAWHRTFPVIRWGVWVSNIVSADPEQQQLFAHDQKQICIDSAIEKIRKKYGLESMKRGLFVKDALLEREVTGFFGEKRYVLE